MSNTDPDYHLDPLNERLLQAPWHVSLDDEGLDGTRDVLAVVPDYDLRNSEEDGFYVRVDSVQVDENGEATSTSQLWEVRDFARFCQRGLALLQADHALERAAVAEAEAAEDEEDEGDDEEEDEGDDLEDEGEDEEEDESDDEDESEDED